jgi:hypothetical protein
MKSESEKRRTDAVELVALKKLNIDEVPDGEEPNGHDAESDSDADELDISKPRIFGKQSGREKTQTEKFGYFLHPTRIEIEHAAASS